MTADKGKGGTKALGLPLYVSHEAARLPPGALLQSSVNLCAAGGGAAAASGLQALLAAKPELRPTGTVGGGATLTVAVLNRLALDAAAGGKEEIDVAGGSSPYSTEGGARRGSRVFAAPDFSATPLIAVDPLRRDLPVGVTLRRRGLARLSLAERLAAVSGPRRGPPALGLRVSSSTGAPAAPAIHKRRALQISRWEELSGNVPRWALSCTNDHRLKHVPLFTALLGLGPGQAGWVPEEGVGKGATEDYALAGKAGKAAAKAAKKAAKKSKKAKAKVAKAKAKAKVKNPGAVAEDEEDEEEEEDDDGEGGGNADDADDAALAATGMRRRPSAVALLAAKEGAKGRHGKGERAEAATAAATKRASRELRARVESMHCTGDGQVRAVLAPGARGSDLDLLLALSAGERAALDLARAQAGEYASVGWETACGVTDAPPLILSPVGVPPLPPAWVSCTPVNRATRKGTAGARAARIAALKSTSLAGAKGGSGDPNGARPLSADALRLVRAMTGSTAGPTPAGAATAGAVGDGGDGSSSSLSSRWPLGGKTLVVADGGQFEEGEDGLPGTLLAWSTVAALRKGGDDASSSPSGARVPALARMAAALASWGGQRPASVNMDGTGGGATPRSEGGDAVQEGTPAPTSRAARIAALRLAALTPLSSRGGAGGYNLWAVSTAKDQPAVHGSLYGLPGGSINGWEDVRETRDLPRAFTLDGASHAALFGEDAPTSLLPALALDPHGDPDSCSNDPYERALSFFTLHTVASGTLLARPSLPFGFPPASSSLATAALLGSPRSLFIVLHGRVRYHTAPPPVGGRPVFSARRAWRALRGFIRVQAAFRFSGLEKLMEGAPDSPVPPPSLGVEQGPPSMKAGEEGMGGLQAGPSVGEGTGGAWVEVSTVAGPIVVGAAAAVNGAPSPSSISTAGPCTLLELRPAVLTRLAAAFPSVAAGLGLLASLGLHDPAALVGAVPCLVPVFADAGPACPAGGDRWLLLASLAALFRPVVLSVGETLWVEGDYGDAAYVVVSGTLALSARGAKGNHLLLATYSRGGCVGDPSLVTPGPRATRAIALCSTTVLRLTAASLRTALLPRPRVWRAVRNAVAWRDPLQLMRLPLLCHLAGGGDDEAAARLTPLAELFRPVVLESGPQRRAVPGAFALFEPPKGAGGDAWDVCAETLPVLTSSPLPVRASRLCSPDARSLLLVLHGRVEARSGEGGTTGAQTFGPADWIGASTLFTPRHAAEVATVSALPSGGAGLGDSGSSESPRSTSPTPRGLYPTTCAVLLGLPRHSLDAFITTLPGAGAALTTWKSSGGKVSTRPIALSPEEQPEGYGDGAEGEWASRKSKAKGLSSLFGQRGKKPLSGGPAVPPAVTIAPARSTARTKSFVARDNPLQSQAARPGVAPRPVKSKAGAGIALRSIE